MAALYCINPRTSLGAVGEGREDTYGTIPRVATADGRARIPTDTFSAIMTKFVRAGVEAAM